MPQQKLKDSIRELGKAVQEQQADKTFVLKLYVTGATRRSTRAIENLRKFCEEHLKGRYSLEIIDIYQQPELLEKEDVIAAPTLVKKLPPPLRKLIGDMSDQERLFIGLNVKPRRESEHEKHTTGTEKTGARSRKRV